MSSLEKSVSKFTPKSFMKLTLQYKCVEAFASVVNCDAKKLSLTNIIYDDHSKGFPYTT